MSIPKPITIDFETFGIESRPDYPPKPVGVSIKYPGKSAKYYAWGHPSKNNCQYSDGLKALQKAYQHKDGLLFQNGKFDVDVAEVHCGLKVPEWGHIHDTMFLLFLDDPHQQELSLKPSAERLLNWPPSEQSAVRDWLIKHQPVEGVKISAAKKSDHYYGKYIAYAPGDLVGRYANADTCMTSALFDLLYPKTLERGMLGAYDRERRLMPILLEMERQGLPVALDRLRADVEMYNNCRLKINSWIINRLKASPDINLDSGAQLMDALIKAGKVDTSKMPKTKTGKWQTNKEALLLGVKDKTLLAVLKYRTQLNTCLSTFMVPWLEVAERSNGMIYTTWNQVKAEYDGKGKGTRTGRLSSTPNFQNIPNIFEPIFQHEEKGLPKCPFDGLPALPKIRGYVIPFEDEMFIDRDYSQQELRILAHFEDGVMLRAYQEDKWLDFHDKAKEELAKMGLIYPRKPVKNTNLGLIYGMGLYLLALRNGLSMEDTKVLKDAILRLYPGLKALYSDMKMRAKNNLPIRTWGGREYYCEPAKLVNGKLMEFDYKMVNVLVQGSAADCTKEAIIRYHDAKHKDARIVLNVHDQITASTPKKIYKTEMEVLKEAMESVEFDIPILSEGDVSETTWSKDDFKPYDRKGKLCKTK